MVMELDKRLVQWTPWPPTRNELRELTNWKLTRLGNIIKSVYGETPTNTLAKLALEWVELEKKSRKT